MPQLLNHLTATIGYTLRLYQGEPGAGGVEITTTAGKAPGSTRVGWFIHYGSGVIKCSSDFTSITNPADVWITGFRYKGKTVQNSFWLDPSINVGINDPSTIIPNTGDRYIIGTAPVGVWAGHPNEIALYIGTNYVFFVPTAGVITFNQNTGTYYWYNGTSWSAWGGSGGATADTLLSITTTIPSGSTYDVTSSGAGYTKTRDNGFLGADATAFNKTEYLQVYLNGMLMNKSVDVVWLSTNTFQLNYIVDNGDEIIIIS